MGKVQKRLRRVAVNHIVGKAAVAENFRADGRKLTAQAAGRAVDDDIETAVQIRHRDGFNAEKPRQFLGLGVGTVGNDDTGRAVFFQNRNHAAHRAACAQKQNGFALDGNVFNLRDVVGQTDTVGIVATQFAVFQQNQRIDRAGSQSAVRMLVRQMKRFLFERYGNVCPATACSKKCRNRLRETINVSANAFVFDFNAFLKGKLLMNLRRLAVCNRVAENGVTGEGSHGRVPKDGKAIL